MDWSEEGVVLGVRRQGESNAVLELFTRGHGRHLGLVRGGRGRRLRPVLQTGNLVEVTWRARLAEHLGSYTVEALELQAARLMDDPFKLAGLMSMADLTRLLPEREPHERLYDAFQIVLSQIQDDAVWPALLVRWELGLLEELGFGLDLTKCAASGSKDNLIYVSPKSGKAVSAEAGEPYQAKLLPLPAFIVAGAGGAPEVSDIAGGFRLTDHFLQRDVLSPRGISMPQSRARVIKSLSEMFAGKAAG
ncbi:MAG: DNA repair protein RecO [Alphaproteobacteria bacterium]|nr:DNA repair protein RecO [Alphaproteobacteria bacterium]